MDYKEKYEQALEKARELLNKGYNVLMPEIFPELQESEDEKVRQEIRNFIWEYPDKLPERTRWLAWFEKQGEKINPYSGTSFEYNGHIWGMCARDNGVDILLDKQLFKHFEKQEENKPADKPRFKVGDWIINREGKYYQIKSVYNVDGGYYIATDKGGEDNRICFSIANEFYHLWSININDAKDGDVLYLQHEGVEHIIIYKRLFKKNFHTILSVRCAYDGSTNDFFEDVDYYHCITSERNEKEIHPATKEQRDLLFAKMKEAGYEWGSEKKELKKIEVKTLDADKVIEWLKNTIKERAENYGVYKATRLILPPYNSIEDLINQFKKDFGL